MFDDLADKDIFDKLERARLADNLVSSSEWKLLKVAADRIVERAVRTFCMTPVSNIEAIIELQQVIKKYKYGLFAEIEMLRSEGDYVFDEARYRGLITPPKA